MSALVGIDVGGTFTDLFHVEDGGGLKVVKVHSTPEDPSVGVLDALTAAGLRGDALGALLHGTTIATNALIERRGARCALITTRGFRDVLELGRRDRPSIYGLTGVQRPLIARDQRWEADERLDATGRVLTPLDEGGLRELAEALSGEELDTIVVSFLHSYANPAHEERAREILLEVRPEWHVVTSNTVLREYYEFERTSTAVVQGYLQPLVSRYAERLVSKLAHFGFRSDALIMQSNGGVVPAERMGERAAHMIRSGPAAGVIAAARLATEAGFDRIVTADMGGTSFDVGIALDGRPQEAESVLLDFRLPVRVPMVDVRTIGAGGGSIASVDRGGILQVGPRSAGSVPGPVSFGRGGTEPTVTDANVVLGRIDADRPIGEHGARLDEEGARRAIAALGEPLGLGVEETAQAILAVVNTRMAGATRLVTLEQGHDPRDFALVAFGGAGPLHGAALLGEIGIRTMLVPRHPGVLCAIGCAVADLRHDVSQTIERLLPEEGGTRPDTVDVEELHRTLASQREQAEAELAADGVELAGSAVKHHLDMAYEGQVHRLRVVVEPGWEAPRLRQAFVEHYEREYGTALGELPVVVVNARTSIAGHRPRADLGGAGTGGAHPAPRSSRRVHFGTWIETPIYLREDLGPGAELDGPLIVEQADTTTVVEPGMAVRVDAAENLVVTVA